METVALYLERIVRAHLSDGRGPTPHRVVIPLTSGSFDGLPLAEAIRRCQEDARRFPEDRAWVLRMIDPT